MGSQRRSPAPTGSRLMGVMPLYNSGPGCQSRSDCVNRLGKAPPFPSPWVMPGGGFRLNLARWLVRRGTRPAAVAKYATPAMAGTLAIRRSNGAQPSLSQESANSTGVPSTPSRSCRRSFWRLLFEHFCADLISAWARFAGRCSVASVGEGSIMKGFSPFESVNSRTAFAEAIRDKNGVCLSTGFSALGR